MLKLRNIILFSVLCLSLFFSPVVVSANGLGGLEKTAEKAGYFVDPTKSNSLPVIIGMVIGVVLSFVGVIFLILMIYGGFIWMTARGNDEDVKKAKELIRATIIGLTIVLSAYAITAFVGRNLANPAPAGQSSTPATPAPPAPVSVAPEIETNSSLEDYDDMAGVTG